MKYAFIPMVLIASLAQAKADVDEPYVIVPFLGQCIPFSELQADEKGLKAYQPSSPRAGALALLTISGVPSDKQLGLIKILSAKDFLKSKMEFETKAEEADFDAWINNSKMDQEQVVTFAKDHAKDMALVTKHFCEVVPEGFFKSLRQGYG